MPRKRLPLRLLSAESDPESADEDPTLTGGLPEHNAEAGGVPDGEGTEISDPGVSVSEAGVFQEAEEEESDADDISSDSEEGGSQFCGTPGSSGVARERLSWRLVQRFEHSAMTKEDIKKEMESIMKRDLLVTGYVPNLSCHQKAKSGKQFGLFTFKNVLY